MSKDIFVKIVKIPVAHAKSQRKDKITLIIFVNVTDEK
jgi:hypothetical protein